MKRLSILAGVAMALLLVVPNALAVDRFYKGVIDPNVNAGVEFHARIRNETAKHVSGFNWFNVPATCTPSGNTATNGDLRQFTMTVHDDGTFHGTKAINGGNLTAKVTGKFSQHTKKVVGTLRVQGAVSGAGANCDTGVRTWRHIPN
jgi:hypothetical protein